MKHLGYSLVTLCLSVFLVACAHKPSPGELKHPCSKAYTQALKRNIASLGGSMITQGRYETIILPTYYVFDGHSSNLTEYGDIILKEIKPHIVCGKRWVLRITVYNAMFDSPRASLALARQQGGVVLSELWQKGITVAGVNVKKAKEQCYHGCARQNFIKIVAKR